MSYLPEAQPPGARGGRGRGGFVPKDLQVLDAVEADAMQSFVEALHIGSAPADKTQKVVAAGYSSWCPKSRIPDG